MKPTTPLSGRPRAGMQELPPGGAAAILSRNEQALRTLGQDAARDGSETEAASSKVAASPDNVPPAQTEGAAGIEPSAPVGVSTEPDDATMASKDARYSRIDLVSGFYPYEWKSLSIRQLEGYEMLAVSRAQKAQKITPLLDALQPTIDRPIRELCIPDLRLVFYWHRFNSYTKLPLTVDWRSRYGNDHKDTELTETMFESVPFKPEGEQWARWKEMGLVLPCAADLEVFRNDLLTEDEAELFVRAQYISLSPELRARRYIDYVRQRIQAVPKMSADLLMEISKFRNSLDFGLKEQVELLDSKFDVEHWMEVLEARIMFLENRGFTGDLELLGDLNTELEKYRSQLERAEAAAQRTVAPGEEVEKVVVQGETTRVVLNLDLLNFFPAL